MNQEDNKLNISSLTWLTDRPVLLRDMRAAPDEDPLVYDQMMMEHLDSVSHPVHLIVKMDNMPSNLRPSMKDFADYKHYHHPNLGTVVLVGIKTNPIVRFIIATLASLKELHVKTFDTLDEALNYLDRVKLKHN